MPTPSLYVPATSRAKRLCYLVLAYLSLGCAILGALLPGLPTTEFVLLAAWASSKSSPRLNRWLHEHRVFGPILNNWANGGVIARRHKLYASVSMLLCFALLLWHTPPLWLQLTAGGGMFCGACWIWSRPESLPVESATV
ncbi:YbaN family protein [Pseudomonas sp. MM211]|uniref:YbaN family protein n=1 Tax=Pseudomonas sp. MM211 TaxID=2866808 RepID=UPI001CED50E1|nr:YbaN family protein [Pseudomonas sp. MM211]UCJ16344.1 YbaN family protein [Pseudomonas sp. MM211]